MGEVLSGKIVAAKIKQEVCEKVAALAAKGVVPKLAVIIVGEDPASKVYVKGKHNDCLECGIDSPVYELPETATQQQLLALINELNNDASVHGLLVQLPLPKHIDEHAVIAAISPAKDVDGFTPVNVGKMLINERCFLPCTPAGVLRLVKETGLDIKGKDCVIIGRSNIVGKPAAILFMAEDATVTVCHSKTQNLAQKVRGADIVVAALGRAKFVTADMVKPGAVVIDVGVNRGEDGKLCGDVDFDAVKDIASYITPVPGGVGLMTRAMLLVNTVEAAAALCGIK